MEMVANAADAQGMSPQDFADTVLGGRIPQGRVGQSDEVARTSCLLPPKLPDSPTPARYSSTAAWRRRSDQPKQEQRNAPTCPEIEWTEDALQLRQFVFDYWGENKRAPNLAAMHAGTGIERRRLMGGAQASAAGIVFVIDEASPNCDILKAPPFSAFPSQVEMYLDGEFHSYIGCAHEGIGVSWTPYFRGREVSCGLTTLTRWSPLPWCRRTSS